jgi:hypothetical protein
MRSSCLVITVAVCVSACAHHLDISSTTVPQWENRNVSELITAIGPFDTTTIQGEMRSYYWNRFGNCQVTARTTREDKIVKIDVQGTTQVCAPYLEKMGESQAPVKKP